jgi:hypothetical protein
MKDFLLGGLMGLVIALIVFLTLYIRWGHF